jgi:hypothetical protein
MIDTGSERLRRSRPLPLSDGRPRGHSRYGAPRLQRAAALGEDDLVAVVLQPGHLCAPAVAHVSNKREIHLSPALCRCVSYSTHANTRT